MAPPHAVPDEADLRALMGKVEREHGLALSGYKRPCLRRRLAVRMRAHGVESFAAYAAVLDRVPGEYDRLLDALTITVTKFFRNPESYAALRDRVVAPLWRESAVRIWSAGCSSGEEPYSLALLFAEHAGARGAARLARRLRIDATDLDPGALEAVRRAEYPAPAVDEVPPALLERFFSGGPPYRLDPAVARLVRPLAHDLTRDAPPDPPYHLIVCRNVVIYFDRPTQERLFESFAAALVPRGRLLLGKVETLFGPARARFELEDPRERLFRLL
jgi:chemotaxis methyl-accepting protein methylase